jgi:excisionase family DNA binding protein
VISPSRFYGVDELRRETGAPRQLLYDALTSGELRAIRRGRRWLVPGSAVLAWMGEPEPAKVGPP